jgi:hypothetical protein
MTRIILQKKFLPASHDDLLLAFQTLDIGMLTSFQLTVALNYAITVLQMVAFVSDLSL